MTSRDSIVKGCHILGINPNSVTETPSGICVDSNIRITGKGLRSLPFPIHLVTGDFEAKGNHLTEFPSVVMGMTDLSYNDLESCEGIPRTEMSLLLGGNRLTSLKGCPKRVRSISVNRNDNLRSLEFAPTVDVHPRMGALFTYDGCDIPDEEYTMYVGCLMSGTWDNERSLRENLIEFCRKTPGFQDLEWKMITPEIISSLSDVIKSHRLGI